MARLFLVCALSLAIALLGVCGTHAHVHSQANPGKAVDAVKVINIVDADHDDDDAIDIDPLVKAFGKLVVQAPVLLLALCCGLLPYISREIWRPRPVRPVLRPPKDRSRFHVFPPSHAPPTSLI